MRRNFWDELMRLHDEIDRLFEDFLRHDIDVLEPRLQITPPSKHRIALPSRRRQGFDVIESDFRTPLTDVWETDKEVIATLELPGVDKKDIKVHATEDSVEVKVEKKQEVKQEDKKKGMYRIERSYSGFYRYITLPSKVNPDKIKATYKNGVLELRMPKLKQKGNGREVRVE